MFTLPQVYNITFDSISHGEKYQKRKRRNLIFPPVWAVRGFLTVDQDNWADFQRQILEFYILSDKINFMMNFKYYKYAQICLA